MDELFTSPVFGISLTLFAYYAGAVLQRRLKSHMANPILIGCIIVIAVLVVSHIPYESYNSGAKYISFLLGPSTVALAVPLYRNIDIILKNKAAIIIGILAGCITGIISASLIALLLGADKAIAVSMAPKSVTSPIAMEISRILGGYPSLTAAVVILTGILGAMAGPEILKLFGVRDKMSVGLALGAASHGIGTTRAIKEGEIEGAMSGLAIGVAGIITSIIAPIILGIFF